SPCPPLPPRSMTLLVLLPTPARARVVPPDLLRDGHGLGALGLAAVGDQLAGARAGARRDGRVGVHAQTHHGCLARGALGLTAGAIGVRPRRTAPRGTGRSGR